MLNFFGIFGGRPSSARVNSPRRGAVKSSSPRYFRPSLEGFEDRVVPAAPVFDMAHVAQAAPVAPSITNVLNITGIQLTNFQVVNNVLTAAGTVTGTLAGLPFTAQITNFALQLVPDDPATPAVECSVLHLELAPIHLSLLGLHVDTSRICLDITATPGGGLLGNLLCGLADGSLLPIGSTLTNLQNELTNLLGGLLSTAAGPGGGGQDASVCTGQCEVLDLTLGPVNLSLLGLNVSLDDCNDGPVQVCVSASRGEGLLGNLLCGLSNFPHLNLNLQDITQLVNTATNLLDSAGNLIHGSTGKLTSLINHLKK